jgi:hypothetical protein
MEKLFIRQETQLVQSARDIGEAVPDVLVAESRGSLQFASTLALLPKMCKGSLWDCREGVALGSKCLSELVF